MKKSVVALMLGLLLLVLPGAGLAKSAPCAHDGGWKIEGDALHVCTICGTAQVHTKTEKTVAPTCSSVGYTMEVCSVCGWEGEQNKIRPQDPNAHDWGIWATVSESTCSKAGEKVRACAICAKVERESLPLAEHELSAAIHDPTCAEDGYTIYTCERCSYVSDRTEIVPRSAAYHVWGEFGVILQPGCTVPGSQERTCSICGANHRKEVEPTGHTPRSVTVEPGCTDGYTVDVCSVCGVETSERTNIVPGGHKWSKWEKTQELSCTQDEVLLRRCSVCAKVEEQRTPAPGHEFKEGVCRATCVSDGYTAMVCAVCGEQDGESYNRVPAGEEHHVWDEYRWERVTEPTCVEWGLYYQGCSYCDATRKVPIKPRGHEGEPRVFEADFANDGYTVEICGVCGMEACPRYDIVPAGMYAYVPAELQVDQIAFAGAQSAVLLRYASPEGEEAAVLELTADAAGVVEVDCTQEWFAENKVVRLVIRSGGLSVSAQAEGLVRVETAAVQEEDGMLLSVMTGLPNDGFDETVGEYRRDVYSVELSAQAETQLRGRCLLITAPMGEGTLLVLSSEKSAG
ncbi:MAG: hypothetical protein Q4A66_06385 [Eubacteriales bacterium]|nr:hypothetical protein [Eubacteriales bacterium]